MGLCNIFLIGAISYTFGWFTRKLYEVKINDETIFKHARRNR